MNENVIRTLRNSETGDIILPHVEADYSGSDGRLVYGTSTEQWHYVGPDDRDYEHGFTPQEMEELGEEKAREVYLSPTGV
jgi:hypothetical protein